jgi:predicted dehydrogenase
MRNATRRVFLGAAGAAAAGVSLGRAARASSAAERVRVAVVGVNGRGVDLARLFAGAEGAEVAAICDVDSRVVGRPVTLVEEATGTAPRVERDFRRLLHDGSIDALAIATPDHWHGPMTVMACLAGKDVYVEKPACHNVVEGRRMVEAARKCGRVVQVGTQRRSAPHVAEAVEYLRSGRIGKVGLARTWMHQKRKPIGHVAASEPPPELDWALWQGPAPSRPFFANRVHYGWHWFWDYGTGELGNNGVHGVDVARWGLGVEAPLRVTSGGGKFAFDDDQEVPDTQIVTWEFDGCALVYEHRMWTAHGFEGRAFGVQFYGTNGTLTIDDKGWGVEDGEPAGGTGSDSQRAHVADFIECVRTRGTPNADVEVGHLSTRLCLLGNIAHRLGRKLTFDGATERFVGDAEADALLGREYGEAFGLPAV